MALVKAEVRRILGRRGTTWGSAIVIALFAIAILIWAILSDKATGALAVDEGVWMIAVATISCSVVVGATAGVYDIDHGTMRYLVLTGVPRWKLSLVRVPALILAIAAIATPGLVIGAAAVLAAGGPAASLDNWFDFFYQPLIGGAIYGLVGLAIGTFLRSNGIAIAVAIILNFVGSGIAGVVAEHVSETAGHLFISSASDIVITHVNDRGISLLAAIAATCGWLVVLLGAATLRVQRAEY